ncbi:MAG: hypothetical protein LYZ66_06825 [Nitrososphaerales archaeon]|nr:hypothetical protein [Nitrososphaerales archaeon]
MIGFALSFGAALAVFLFPTLLGLIAVSGAARFVDARYLAAFGIGLYFWFFIDTIGDASILGLDEGFSGGVAHLLLWVVFAAGLVLFFALDRRAFTADSPGIRLGFAIPLLIALAVGMHGFGEGAGIAATAATTPSLNLLDAFGGLTQALAFFLHKLLEPMMVGAAYWVYSREQPKRAAGRLGDLTLLMLAFAIPGIIGAGVGYYLVLAFQGIDLTYVFAFGLGTSLYAAFRLTRPLYEGVKGDAVKTALAFLLGFTCLYLAALLHG